MKNNINKVLKFLNDLFERIFWFAILMLLIAFISIFLIGIFNFDIALIVFFFNLFIGFIPFVIIILFIAILNLIKLIIYGED